MKELSKITETFTESVIREMTRISDAMNGINLSQGFPDFDCPPEIKRAAIDAVRNGKNQYPVTFGEPELRRAIAKKAWSYNRIKCDPDTDITVTCGATEAMMATLRALINPGDEIIIFEPFYENYGPDGILSGATPRYVALNPPDWNFDRQKLATSFNNKTKAIIINTPNNPTGKVFSGDELDYISKLCLKWNVYAVTDEIYEHILYDGEKHISMGSLPGMADRTITINSLSKTYSVTGWRVGWAIASGQITHRIRKVHDFMTVGAPTPLQHAGVTALNFPEKYYVALAEKYEKSRNHLYRTLSAAGFMPYLPKGAYYMIADYSPVRKRVKPLDDFDFSRKLLKKTRIATVPGSSFYSNKIKNTGKIRFAFCKKTATLELTRDLFEKYLG